MYPLFNPAGEARKMGFPVAHERSDGAHRAVHLFCRIWTQRTAPWDACIVEISPFAKLVFPVLPESF